MMERKKGKIINIGSIDGYHGMRFEAAYCASKAGVHLFSKALAEEWVNYNINVNVIAPGWAETALAPWMLGDEKEAVERRETAAKTLIPMKRFCPLRDLGLLAVYLASAASDYMTGEVITIDGGYTIW